MRFAQELPSDRLRMDTETSRIHAVSIMKTGLGASNPRPGSRPFPKSGHFRPTPHVRFAGAERRPVVVVLVEPATRGQRLAANRAKYPSLSRAVSRRQGSAQVAEENGGAAGGGRLIIAIGRRETARSPAGLPLLPE